MFLKRHCYFARYMLLAACVIIILLALTRIKLFGKKMSKLQAISQNNSREVIIATVICGDRLQQGLVMLKSAIVFQVYHKLRFIIIAEYKLQKQLRAKLKKMNKLSGFRFKKFTYQLFNISFPKGKEKEWYKEFRPCATARLFLPNIVPDVDKVIYVDSDSVFVNRISLVWKLFYEMSQSHLIAMALEDLEPNKSVYSGGQVKVPYYGVQGLNSGIMLMDLKKMREFGLVYQAQLMFEMFRSRLKYGDQDILNIIFHYFPERPIIEKLSTVASTINLFGRFGLSATQDGVFPNLDKVYVIPCYYNYRSNYCTRTNACEEADPSGPIILHGTNHTFESNSFPDIKAVYDTFYRYELNQNPITHLLTPLLKTFKRMPRHRCGKMSVTIVKNMNWLFSRKNKLIAN